jgi:cardiolipin-specific phospholipase
MLSPAGVCAKPEDFDVKKMRFKDGRGPPKFIRKIASSAWSNKWSPFGVMRKSGSLFGSFLIKKYVNGRMGNLPENEREDLRSYLHQIFMRDGSSEYAIFICFEPGMWPINPLENSDRLGNSDFPIPVSFFYGDVDWMDYRGG